MWSYIATLLSQVEITIAFIAAPKRLLNTPGLGLPATPCARPVTTTRTSGRLKMMEWKQRRRGLPGILETHQPGPELSYHSSKAETYYLFEFLRPVLYKAILEGLARHGQDNLVASSAVAASQIPPSRRINDVG